MPKNTEMKRKYFIIYSLIIMGASLGVKAQEKTFFDYKAKDTFGDTINLSVFKGKKVLVVNTASKCGFTSQYEGLEKLYRKYKNNDFVIVAFPANNFMSQEPGTNEDIRQFCNSNYDISFQLMSKISVKGSNQHCIYQWLTSKELNGKENSKVKWNFQKYMINPDGSLHGYLKPSTDPFDEEIISWIETN
jgi:glutathione peroxidase